MHGWICAHVAELQRILARRRAPEIGIGDHCHQPYTGEFREHRAACVEWPEHPIGALPRLRGSR